MGELFVRPNFPPIKAVLSVIRAALFGLVIREKGLSYVQYLVRYRVDWASSM